MTGGGESERIKHSFLIKICVWCERKKGDALNLNVQYRWLHHQRFWCHRIITWLNQTEKTCDAWVGVCACAYEVTRYQHLTSTICINTTFTKPQAQTCDRHFNTDRSYSMRCHFQITDGWMCVAKKPSLDRRSEVQMLKLSMVEFSQCNRLAAEATAIDIHILRGTKRIKCLIDTH